MNMQVGKVNNFFFQKVKGFHNKDEKFLHAFIFSYYLQIVVVAATIDGFDWI